MRTRNFSGAPRLAQAGAMFTGATRYTGPIAWLRLWRTWRPLVARMKSMPGYCWHTVYWEPPFVLGTIAYFESRDDLLTIARSPEHRRLMLWITRSRKNGTAGYIRLFTAEPDGYTNGAWRAEGDVMGLIENFTPLSTDDRPRPVKDAASEIR